MSTPEGGASASTDSAHHTPWRVWEHLSAARGEMRPVLLWSAVVGAMAGAVGGVYRRVLDWLTEQRGQIDALPFPDGLGWLAAGIGSALAVGAALWLVRRFAPEAGGSGVQEIEGALEGLRPIRWRRIYPVKFVGGLLGLGGGLVLGREGPTIQMGGAGGKMISEWFGLDAHDTHVLVAAGAGAGLTAAFSAPFAGILFVVEEMRPQFRYSMASLQAVVIACALADIVVEMIVGSRLEIPVAALDLPSGSLWLFPVLGVIFGLVGVAFNGALVATTDWMARRRAAVALGLGMAFGAFIGVLGYFDGQLIGDGHRLMHPIVTGGFSLATLLILFVARFFTTVGSYGIGAPGGIFAPMLALGALLGTAFGDVVVMAGADFDPTLFAVAGIGALFAATVRAPLTGIALAVELTGAFNQFLPLMLTCAVATLVAQALGSPPIYTTLLERTLQRAKAAQAQEDAA